MSNPSAVPDIGSTTGPILLGYLFNWALLGILTVQVYFYYLAFPADRWYTKTLVSGLYVLETLQTILATHDAYAYFGPGFANPAMLQKLLLAGLNVPIITGIVSCVVQTFFAYRINLLSGSRVVALPICLIALMQASAAVVAGIKTFLTPDYAYFHDAVFVPSIIWLISSAVCDILIVALMSYLLHRGGTNFRSTQVLVSRLVRLTIETGGTTATIATLDLILYAAFPNNTYFVCSSYVVSKVYSNTCIAMLNSRIRLVGGRNSYLAPMDPSLSFPTEFQSRQDRCNHARKQVEGIQFKNLACERVESVPRSDQDLEMYSINTKKDIPHDLRV